MPYLKLIWNLDFLTITSVDMFLELEAKQYLLVKSYHVLNIVRALHMLSNSH